MIQYDTIDLRAPKSCQNSWTCVISVTSASDTTEFVVPNQKNRRSTKNKTRAQQ